MKYEDRLRAGIRDAWADWDARDAERAPVLLAQGEVDCLIELVAAVRALSVLPVEGMISTSVTRMFAALTALDEVASRG